MTQIACGVPEWQIAQNFGIFRMTLRKHLADELMTGRAKKKAEKLKRLWKAAGGGNVSAMIQLHGLFEHADKRLGRGC